MSNGVARGVSFRWAAALGWDGWTMRVMTVFGTRPEVVKLAPVIQALARLDHRIQSIVCSTGQHRDMIVPFCELFGVVPDIELGVMCSTQTLGGLTGNLFLALDPVVRDVKPDWIVSQGDTTTVLVASLCAYYNQIRFAHVEAGLRTGDRRRPFPEEVNRRVADMIADLCFVPTERARQNLLSEGAPAESILLTGNTVVDALHHVAALPYDWLAGPLRAVPREARLVLVTAHRRESFGKALLELCRSIRELADRFADSGVFFVYPVHLNPNVQMPVREILSAARNVILLEPLDYLSFVNLLKRATVVLTDSGGVQEEAPTFGVPVLVARETTERLEGVEQGVAKLVGTSRDRIVPEVSRILTNPQVRASMAIGMNPYGDGQAARRIVAALTERLDDLHASMKRRGRSKCFEVPPLADHEMP